MIYKQCGTAVEIIGGPYLHLIGSLLDYVEVFAVRHIAPDINGKRPWGYYNASQLKADKGISEIEAATTALREREGQRTVIA